MNAAAAPTTPSRFRGPIVPNPAAAPPGPARRPGLDPAALAELRNAAATYDFLRKKGDPAQFWEMLRLARSRRAILAPAEGEALAPAPEVEAGIVHELDSIRNQYVPLVRDLRRYLKDVPGLPEPQDRLEMALAFLLASAREHQAVAKWLAEPGKHETKAAEKLRSLATITDPYREALQPWTLKVWSVDEEAFEKLEIEVPPPPPPPAPPEPPATARVDAPSLDVKKVEIVRRAVECRPILARVQADLALWETLLLVTVEPETTQAALDALTRELQGDMVKQAEIDLAALEKLGDGVTELRGACAEWVQSMRTLSDQQLAPGDPRAFEVGLGLLLSTPGAQDRLHIWLEDPPTWQDEVLGLLGPWIRRAQDYLAAMDSSRE
jgi:hypothetical protein